MQGGSATHLVRTLSKESEKVYFLLVIQAHFGANFYVGYICLLEVCGIEICEMRHM